MVAKQIGIGGAAMPRGSIYGPTPWEVGCFATRSPGAQEMVLLGEADPEQGTRLDSATINFVIYRRHRLMNPMSTGQLARVLAFTDLRPGDKAVDLGCGGGFLTDWIAARYQLEMTGVERFGPMTELARDTAASGRFRLVEIAAADYLASAGEHRLLSTLGAIDVVPGLVRPVDVMAALLPSIAPGGWLLWGDPFWKRPPSPRLNLILAGDRFESLAGWMQAGERAGLTPHYISVSPEEDWEEYIWRMNASMIEWADDHVGTADADDMRERAQMLRTLYLEEGRDDAGFGLYLFRRPLSRPSVADARTSMSK